MQVQTMRYDQFVKYLTGTRFMRDLIRTYSTEWDKAETFCSRITDMDKRKDIRELGVAIEPVFVEENRRYKGMYLSGHPFGRAFSVTFGAYTYEGKRGKVEDYTGRRLLVGDTKEYGEPQALVFFDTETGRWMRRADSSMLSDGLVRDMERFLDYGIFAVKQDRLLPILERGAATAAKEIIKEEIVRGEHRGDNTMSKQTTRATQWQHLPYRVRSFMEFHTGYLSSRNILGTFYGVHQPNDIYQVRFLPGATWPDRYQCFLAYDFKHRVWAYSDDVKWDRHYFTRFLNNVWWEKPSNMVTVDWDTMQGFAKEGMVAYVKSEIDKNREAA